ncbi:hypothetical protein ACN27G_17875 [Plantactinospora sp. WMMB334]|uniref:hypothetical protein n=1 Tax=Plantactinospora sp. WMMB334 TaxID=3404119 RepID=UPI003B9517EE
MKGWLPLTLGLLAVVVGAVWTLQGLGRLGGSVMTGEPVWAVVGPLVVVAGLVLVVLGLRARNRRESS